MTPQADGRRHALVVASQCESEGNLDGLGGIAARLRNLLLEDRVGCCAAGLPNGMALLADPPDADAITREVSEAIGYAADNGATLLLAFLGHGFIQGTHPRLYFMGRNSVEGNAESSVNVTDVLTRAANKQGIQGVAAIIDTCTAAAAIPEAGALTGGALTGQTRLSLVMASAAGQPAYGMDLSRQLVRLLQDGVPGAGPHLRLSGPAVKAALRAALPGQPPVFYDYDGAVTGAGDPWLARNARAEAGTLGSYGLAALTEALAPLLPALEREQLSAVPDAAGLRALRRAVAALPASPARTRVERLLDSLHAAHETVAFLRDFMPLRLREEALRRALIAAGGSGGPPAGPARIAQVATEVDAVEYAAVSYPRADRSCRPQLTRFVVELADEGGLDLDAPALRDWAASIDAIVPFNKAVAVRRQWRSERRLRLVISLHYAPAGNWPDKLGVWLLYDGQFYQRIDLGCTPDQRGAEEALTKAVDWAEERAEELKVPLRRVEVAVPVSILLRWRPEEVRYVRRLGLDYEVLTRWSQRLDRGPAMRRINRNAERRLAEIDDGENEPLHWLRERHVADLAALHEEFVNGRYSRAIGLVDDPGENERLFEVLLEFAPILLWPRAGELGREHQDMVSARWGELPAAFAGAYRALHAGGEGGPLADLRAIWDDKEWLSFCRDLRVQPGGTEE